MFSRVFVDNGTLLKVMPLLVLNKLDKNIVDLIPTNIKMASFMGEASNALLALIFDVVAGPKEVQSYFFIINDKPSYFVFLCKYRIHTSECISSRLYQRLIFQKVLCVIRNFKKKIVIDFTLIDSPMVKT